VLIGLAAPLGESRAQKATADKIGMGAVTILTDGISDPQGDVSRAFGQLAQRVSEVGKLRVLPLMGSGGPGNARDLLHLRGIDFAVVNSDVLAYFDLFGGYPEARKRLRYVTPLLEDKVYLFARKRYSSLEDLKGGKVMVLGQDSPGFVTAMTLFGLSRIEIQVISSTPGSSNPVSLGEADAALFVGRELSRVQLDQESLRDLHLLPIPGTPRLTGVYQPSIIFRDEIPGMTGAGNIETLQVSALLTVFDWQAIPSTRQQPVANFIKAFFDVLPELQRGQPELWKDANVNAAVPGWERYGPAETLRRNVQFVSVAPQPVSRQPLPQLSALTPAQRAVGTPQDTAGSELLRVIVSNRPPLTDTNQGGGGLISELLVASLEAGDAGAKAPKIDWARSRNEQLGALLGDKPLDIAVPWETPDCDRPNDLTAGSAIVCDRMVLSDPLFQVVIGLFVRADSDFKFQSDESVANRIFCVPQDLDTADFNRGGRNWLTQRQVTLVRAPSLVECLGLVERREADAAVANELEGRFTIERIGLGGAMRMLERPLAMRGIHAVVAKDNPRASEILKSINDGLVQIKKRDAYLAVVKKHVLGLLTQQVTR
jgi:polar amino acid transport system substrate-binding protein